MELNEVIEKIKKYREPSHKIIFTNGCFDILHLGHIHILKEAKRLGGKLIVGVNSDASVLKLKGEGRPVKDEQTRVEILKSFWFVDLVVIFDEDTPLGLIKGINPDVLVKGGDYEVKDIVGYDHVTGSGGKVVTIPIMEGLSSTKMIGKLNK